MYVCVLTTIFCTFEVKIQENMNQKAHFAFLKNRGQIVLFGKIKNLFFLLFATQQQ